MNRLVRLLCAFVVMMLGAMQSAHAFIVYNDNAGATYSNGVGITSPMSAIDDFVLTDDVILDSITFWAVSSDPTVFTDYAAGAFTFSYGFFGDSGGTPNLGDLIDFQDTTGGAIQMDGSFFGFPVYQVTLDLVTPLALDIGTTYWLGLTAHFLETRDVTWLDHSPVVGNDALWDSGTFSYSTYGADAAFYLSGHSASAPSSLLLLAPLGLLLGFRRMNKSTT